MTKLQKPLLIYDGDCAFCLLWIKYWRTIIGEKIDYSPFQRVASHFPEIPHEHFHESVMLIKPEGGVSSGAQAVFESLAYGGKGVWLRCYKTIPGFATCVEAVYDLIAKNRSLFYKLTIWLWGKNPKPPTFYFSRQLFLRLLGVVYFIAFFSLATQIIGLVGENGILPAVAVWPSASDSVLLILSWGGAALSILAILDIWTAPILTALWLFYLLLFYLGQAFLSFQWDILLLEVGFLAVFLAVNYSILTLWAYRLLLFKFIFSSGMVKLLSGDSAWRDLTALNYHYWSQPLPTLLAWYTHQLPEWFQKFSVGAMFFIQLVVPFFIFAPRRLRLLAGSLIIFLEILIGLTGNYNFFGLLTISMCLLFFDDQFVANLWKATFHNIQKATFQKICGSWQVLCHSIVALLITFNIIRLTELATSKYWLNLSLPIVNHYGLFAVMTKTRPEIIIEGSNDGINWQEYEFKYKAGDVGKILPWVQPHQPRLDWQMWFAALLAERSLAAGGGPVYDQWFINFVEKLLQGSPEVLTLLEKNSFPEKPPKYIRALLYDYKFSKENWWERKLIGLYLPAISLEEVY